jgi:hypothetical protein
VGAIFVKRDAGYCVDGSHKGCRYKNVPVNNVAPPLVGGIFLQDENLAPRALAIFDYRCSLPTMISASEKITLANLTVILYSAFYAITVFKNSSQLPARHT